MIRALFKIYIGEPAACLALISSKINPVSDNPLWHYFPLSEGQKGWDYHKNASWKVAIWTQLSTQAVLTFDWASHLDCILIRGPMLCDE